MKSSDPLSLLAVVAVSAVVGWVLGHSSSSPRHSVTARQPTQTATVAASRPAGLLGLPRGWAFIAVPARHVNQVAVYWRPNSRRVRVVLPRRSSIGVPLALLVHQIRAGWIQTYLPMRPDGTTGWIRRRAVKLVTTAWAVHVHLHRHRLFVLVRDHVIRDVPIGVGRSVTPTPSGRYFVTELLKQPDPTGVYGPYAFGLSAYSGVLTHFGRGGNGQIGIHGTNEPQRLGTNVSHGCIRIRNGDIIWLSRRLPLGTPVLIDRT